MKKIIFALAIVLFLSGCSLYFSKERALSSDAPQQDNRDLPSTSGCEGLACLEMPETLCLESGGKWNDCGSPCLGTNAEVCIEMCSAQCECGQNQYHCPDGFTCRLVDSFEKSLGVCIQAQVDKKIKSFKQIAEIKRLKNSKKCILQEKGSFGL